MTLVPNHFPRFDNPSKRLAIVGEAPGAEEELIRQPFVGPSGKLLRFVLGSLNFTADACFLGNVCQLRPPNNDIEQFDFNGPEIQSGIAQLASDLATFQPNCVLALGRTAFRVFNPSVCYTGRNGEIIIPISNWRGSLFKSEVGNYKTLGCYHPAYIQRQYSDIGLFRFDVARAVQQSTSPELSIPTRRFITRPSLSDVVEFCSRVIRDASTIAFDIEGICDNIGVNKISLFTSPSEGIVIPFWIDSAHYWSLEDEATVWQCLASVLGNRQIPKITQNGLYELFCLLWHHRLVVEGITEDTMYKHWELFPEFEKSLGVQCSIYTLEPYYKDDRKSNDTETQLIYNGKDSAVTFECSLAQDQLIKKNQASENHYRFNINLMPAFTYMHARGVRIDRDRLETLKAQVRLEIDTLNASVEAVLSRTFNAKSIPNKKWLLYEYFNYTPYARKGTSTDEETLHRYYQKYKEPVLKQVIQLVSKRTRLSDLNKLTLGTDNRIRTSYNPVGAVTGRLASSNSYCLEPYFSKKGVLSWEYTGTNLQNQTKAVREVFIADPGCLFYECDLSGADAWTVAADLAALGHPTMLEDLRFGLKPAKVLLLMLAEIEAKRDPALFNQLDRAEILRRQRDLPDPGDTILPDGRPANWKYTCMKRVQHGTNYEMKPERLSTTIFKDSDGLIDLPEKDAAFYQLLYKLRYNPQARSAYILNELSTKGFLQSACGIRRKFYSIRNPRMVDDSILRDAVAQEPQGNTTFVCNSGLYNLWSDPQNRTRAGGLFVEPLIQIHDALAGQFNERFVDFARTGFRRWLTVPLLIHGLEITIPFEGKFGHNWLQLENKL